jgi:predicted PurR-regulated permease PerM
LKRELRSSDNSHLSGVVTGTVIVLTLYFAKVVFLPIALALLLSFLLTPVVTIFERIKFPRALAILIVMTALVGVIGALGWKTYGQLTDLAGQIPTYKGALIQKIHALKGQNTQTLSKVSATVRDLENEITNPAPGAAPNGNGKQAGPPQGSRSNPTAVEVISPANPLDTFESMVGPLATGGIILVFTIFMLMDREDLRNRFIRLAGGSRLSAMTQALEEASQRINRYLLLQLLVNAGYGIIIGIALHFIGIPNASLWGVAATILRFIPYAGPPMSAAMPILLSLAIFPGWSHTLETMALFATLEIIVSNFVEPPLYGSHVGLSALAVLVAAIFWTLIWGLPGLVLSTPLTAFIVVMGRYLPGLSSLSVLLGDEPVLPLSAQFYQRLLAVDHVDAKLHLERWAKEKPLDEIYETVVVPALSHAEHDRYKDEIDESSKVLMLEGVREMVETLGEIPIEKSENTESNSDDTGQADLTSEETNGPSEIICIPARDDADDVMALMLCQLIERRGFKSRNISLAPVPEMLSQLAELKPRIICIAALPPFAMSHARGLYRQCRTLSPQGRVVICLWHYEGDLQKTAARMKMTSGDSILVTLPQVLEYAQQEIAPSIVLGAVS